MTLAGTRVLLVITGGIAAYKTPELVRLLRKAGAEVRCVLTKSASEFVTPMTLATLSNNKVFGDLWSLTDEHEIGHIRLSREADVILIAPATANFMAKLAIGQADDLASTCLLAAPKHTPIVLAPSMNPAMYADVATQENIKTLSTRGCTILTPDSGEMACGETGEGRMREPAALVSDLQHIVFNGPLAGKHAIVTSGPTFEAIDSVRFLGNRSSGKQGHAIAQALRQAGAGVTLVTGPVSLPDPTGIKTVAVETAAEMWAAVEAALPADVAVCAAAVADWKMNEPLSGKLKKRENATPPALNFVETVDILKTLGHLPPAQRPKLVVGFAAETEQLETYATGKLASKKADVILGNLVTNGAVFGSDTTHIIAYPAAEDWGSISKIETANRLKDLIVERLLP